MKEKIYLLVKKMEQEGWELITLTTYVYKSTGRVVWYAKLLKDEIYVYIEVETEKTGMIDVQLECPDCGREPSVLDENFCPDCEKNWVYKKDIPSDYK